MFHCEHPGAIRPVYGTRQVECFQDLRRVGRYAWWPVFAHEQKMTLKHVMCTAASAAALGPFLRPSRCTCRVSNERSTQCKVQACGSRSWCEYGARYMWSFTQTGLPDPVTWMQDNEQGSYALRYADFCSQQTFATQKGTVLRGTEAEHADSRNSTPPQHPASRCNPEQR